MSKRLLSAAAGAALIAGSLVVLPPASASVTQDWEQLTELSASTSPASVSAKAPQVAVNQAGTQAVAVWGESDSYLWAATARIDAGVVTWSDPQQVFDGSGPGAYPEDILVEISADGTRATAFWSTRSNQRAFSASAEIDTATNTATWGSATDFGRSNVSQPALALSNDGTVAIVVVVQDGEGTQALSNIATISGTTQTWGSRTAVPFPGNPTQVAVAGSDDLATAVIASASAYEKDFQAVGVTRSGTSATYGTSGNPFGVTAADGATLQNDGLDVTADGSHAILAGITQETPDTVRAASASVSGTALTWGSTTDLATADTLVQARLGLSADGTRATAGWVGESTFTVSARSAMISGTSQDWGATADVAGSGTGDIDPKYLAMAVTPDAGRATMQWFDDNDDRVRTSSAEIGGKQSTWATPVTVTNPDGPQQLGQGDVAISAAGAVGLLVIERAGSPAKTTGGTLTKSAPTVTAVSPPNGPTAGGTRITITGTGFTNGATAEVGGVACTDVVVLSPTSLECTTGAHPDAVVNVSVTAGSQGTLPDGFTYGTPATAPTITAVEPDKGTEGTEITITGTGFVAGTTVTVGGKTCKDVVVVSATKVTCKAPAGTGRVAIVVTTPGGSATKADAFTYSSDPDPLVPPTPSNVRVIVEQRGGAGSTKVRSVVRWRNVTDETGYVVRVNGTIVCRVKADVTSCTLDRLLGPGDRVTVQALGENDTSSGQGKAKSVTAQGAVAVGMVHFSGDSPKLSRKAKRTIARTADLLRAKGYRKATIRGYTAIISDGPARFRQQLSDARADNTAARLRKDADGKVRTRAIGRAGNDPIASNATKKGRAENRRAVISLK